MLVAASFSFFGGQHVRAQRPAWIARIFSEIPTKLDEIEENNRSIAAVSALEDVIRNTPPRQRAQLGAVAYALQHRTEVVDLVVMQRITTRIADDVPAEALRERIAVVQRAAGASLSSALREGRAVIERVRYSWSAGQPPAVGDLLALEVERSRSRAAREEARSAARQVVVSTVAQWFPGGPFVEALAAQLVARADGLPRGRVDPIDHATASVAVREGAYPPRVYFDIARITSPGAVSTLALGAAIEPRGGDAPSVVADSAASTLITTSAQQVAGERAKDRLQVVGRIQMQREREVAEQARQRSEEWARVMARDRAERAKGEAQTRTGGGASCSCGRYQRTCSRGGCGPWFCAC
jgi:hypothetical protein